MANFLDNYELANDTIKRFRSEFVTGRIVTSIAEANLAQGWVLVKAEVYREYEDTLPSAVDFAYGNVATYPANMKKWYVEDTVTSCIARCIKLLSPSDQRPSRENMMLVENAPPVTDDLWATLSATPKTRETDTKALSTAVAEIQGQLGGELVPAPPRCGHGTMVWKQAAAGSPKNWGGYFCTERTKATQCAPNWHVMTSSGQWKSQI
jgi:hypothetical protein